MAMIELREYVHEIDSLVERGQIDEAIAHCRQILAVYPKYIDTYRLLGKAFLEQQKYSEAADVLQRVLSVFPDDFISQIGMSIIREDEGNLDSAIWHMERAFEVQNSNSAVQDELRRLYGRRDGKEPARIRLTRGTLVRMYIRGGLFPQAVAEIRAALNEDSNRLDLETVLVRALALANRKTEATEVATNLIQKLPYCYEANRLLAEVLPGTSRIDDAKIYMDRILSLDPYAVIPSMKHLASSSNGFRTIKLDRLDWKPSTATSEPPDWARTVGVQWEEPEAAQIPDWLKMPEEQPTSDFDITQNSSQTPSVPAFLQQTIPDEILGDQAFSLPEIDIEQPAIQHLVEEVSPELSKTEVEPNIPEETTEIQPANEQIESTAAAQEVKSEIPSENTLPDWLSQIRLESETTPEQEEVAATETVPPETVEPVANSDTNLPDWLLGFEKETASAAPTQEIKLAPPDLPKIESQPEIIDQNAETNHVVGDQLPDWLQHAYPEEQQPEVPSVTVEQIEKQQSVEIPAGQSAEAITESQSHEGWFPEEAGLAQASNEVADNKIQTEPQELENIPNPEESHPPIAANIEDFASIPSEVKIVPSESELPAAIAEDQVIEPAIETIAAGPEKGEWVSETQMMPPQTVYEASKLETQVVRPQSSIEKTEPTQADTQRWLEREGSTLTAEEAQQTFSKIVEFLQQGQLDEANPLLDKIISSGKYVDETIQNLQEATYRFPVDESIWQKLGDAYAHNNRIQDAINAYKKAEDLIQ
jgi:tetratricopeptide (TPR) repeat protein